MNPFLKRLLRYFIAICVLAAIIIVASTLIDEKRKEESARKEKIESGNCEFDEIDLKSLALTYNSRYFKPILDLDSLKMIFSEYLADLDVDTTLTEVKEKSFRIENNTFTYYQKGRKAYIKSIELDFSSPFTCKIGGHTEFAPDFQLDDFKEIYPKSYACRWNQNTSWRSEMYVMRIGTNRIGSDLNGLLLYFTNAENLFAMDFVYSFEEE